MDYNQLFTQTWHILRRTPLLWVLGFFAMSLNMVGHLVMRLGSRWASQSILQQADLEQALERLLRQVAQPGVLIAGVVGLTCWLLLVWVVLTVGEGGLIGTTAQTQRGQPTSLGSALRQGADWLPSFIAIDTIVFFPLFVLLLAIMIIGAAALFLAIILGAQRGDLASVFLPLIIGGVISTGLGLFTIPLSLATIAFRHLAFRAAALRQTGVRQSVRLTWQIIRQKTGPVIVITALIFGISYLLGTITTLLLTPFIFIGGFPTFDALATPSAPSPIFSPDHLILTFIHVGLQWGLQSCTFVIVSVFWTVGFGLVSSEQAAVSSGPLAVSSGQ
ncbi:MAG: hypothetical protein KJ063_22690 [Anaerolineae bacterium]|nr:hypothetical protein [Anaerolineae bacterium]